MPLTQILLTAASLAAAGGGAIGLDRIMDGFCRIPAVEQEVESASLDDSHRSPENRLNY
jgi:hypothetical protein